MRRLRAVVARLTEAHGRDPDSPARLVPFCRTGVLVLALLAVLEVLGNLLSGWGELDLYLYRLELWRVIAWNVAAGLALGAGAFVFARAVAPISVFRPGRREDAVDLGLAAIWGAALTFAIMTRLRQELFANLGFGRLAFITFFLTIFITFVLDRLSVVVPQKVRRAFARAEAVLPAVLVVLALTSGAWRMTARPPATPRAPAVFLISLDTVRADHLEVYGYARPTSPSLKRFAEDAVVFDAAYAPEPWTLPSHISMMTSLHPVRHQVRSTTAKLADEENTLAEILNDHGYATRAFVSMRPGGFVGGERGFDQGFDRYLHKPHYLRRSLGSSVVAVIDRLLGPVGGSAEDVVDAALDFLEVGADPSQKLFVFLHFYDAHSDWERDPYDASAKSLDAVTGGRHRHVFPGCDDAGNCATRFFYKYNCPDGGTPEGETPAASVGPDALNDIVDHYDAGLRDLDARLGDLFDGLKKNGLYDDALIVVTADHGEQFHEHGGFLHARIFNEVQRVPLIVKLPSSRRAGRRSDRPVELVDVMPTVLDVVDLHAPQHLQGRSVLDVLDPGGVERPLFFSNSTLPGDEPRTVEIGVMTAGEKLILPLLDPCTGTPVSGEAPRHYALRDDPGENVNLASGGLSPRGEELLAMLRAWYESQLALARSVQAGVELDEESRRLLRALGYLD